MKYLILLASVIFLAQSCSVAPSMRESARSYDWATYTNFSWQSKIDSAISSYPLLLYPSYEAKGSAGFTVPLFYHMDKIPATQLHSTQTLTRLLRYTWFLSQVPGQ